MLLRNIVAMMTTMMDTKSYNEMLKFDSFDERVEYLKKKYKIILIKSNLKGEPTTSNKN